MTTSIFRVIWAIYRKDLAVWWRNRVSLAASILPVLGFLVVQAVGASSVGTSPVALVDA